jgi:4-hydroxy 2-oxovalerate aldolase
MMGIISYAEKELLKAVETIKTTDIDYVYFADSYGSMTPSEIEYYSKTLRSSGKKVGFHAHNNMQLAFANTLEAIRNQVDIVDATVFGMGRGAGNVPLEVLLSYLQKVTDSDSYNALPVLDIADRYFIALMKEYNWGYQLPYMLSGIFKVHPTYARELVERHEYGMEDMVKALEEVREEAPVGYKKKVLENVIEKKIIAETASPQEMKQEMKLAESNIHYVDRHQGRDFLILATGPSLKKSHKELKQFINKYDPITIGTNYLEGLFEPDYHMFSNKRRFVNYVDAVNPQSKLLVSSSFEEEFIEEYTSRPFEVVYHLFNKERFEIDRGVLRGDFRTVALLGIATAICMGAKRIFIAGMDGYQIDHQVQDKDAIHFYQEPEEAEQKAVLREKHIFNENMLTKITEFLKTDTSRDPEIRIITPTSYTRFYSPINEWNTSYESI